MTERRPLSQEEQDVLKSKAKENNKCVDCGKKFPIWASTTLGVVICLNCAGVHRSLGVSVSFVRSLPLDSWKDSEILAIRHGGNKRWKKAMLRTGAPDHLLFNGKIASSEAIIRERYTSNVAKAYSKALKAIVAKKAKSSKEMSDGETPKYVDVSKLPRWKSDPKIVSISEASRRADTEGRAKKRIQTRFGPGGGGVEFERRRREQEARENRMCSLL
eukprot:g1301.t1